MPQLLTAVATLAFTSVWTSSALTGGAPLFFVAFATPFWYVGALALRSAVLPLVEEGVLEISRGGLRATRCVALGGRRWAADDARLPWRQLHEGELPLRTSVEVNTNFLVNWLTDELNNYLTG